MRPFLLYVPVQITMAACLFASVALCAHAQGTSVASSSTAATSSTAVKETIQTQAASSTATSAAASETGYPAEKQDRLTDLAANISNRIDAATARLTDISNRIDSRIGKLSDQGIDMTDPRFYLSKARESLASVQSDMGDIDNRVAATVSSEKPFTDWTNIKDTFVDAKARLESAKKLLQESVDQMNFRIQMKQDNGTNAQASTSTPITASSSN